MNRVDTMAEIKVTTDTTSACVFLPAGILHTISPLPCSAPSPVGENKQLWLGEFPSMLQRTNTSGALNLTLE